MESCVFNTGWLGIHEQALFGRERDPLDAMELRFGITRSRFIARLKRPAPGAQWSGIITRMAEKALSAGVVEGVVTLHHDEKEYFRPVPVLAMTEEDIRKAKGSIPVLSPVLASLEEAVEKGLKRILVIGAACHIHALRDFQRRSSRLADMEIYTIGIPCVDNAKPNRLHWMLERISRAPQTVRHLEFMADFRIHLRHLDGRTEKIPYFSLPEELSNPDIFPPSCMSCFDYLNGLSDITVGYLAAPFGREKNLQWVLVRTEKGEQLEGLLDGELERRPESGTWECSRFIASSGKASVESMKPSNRTYSPKPKVPRFIGTLLAAFLRRTGPKGIGFARFSADHHLIRHYYFVKYRYPHLLESLVPKHAFLILKEYGLEP
ncbi:MAG: Coenzyme F420 hydrogenase/dehydrogenase, beta subunit C-terminal domain [Chlorobiaceae bacterium]